MNDRYSFLNSIHIKDLELLYQKYKVNPDSIEPSWSAFFYGFDLGNEKHFVKKFFNYKEFLVYNLIQAYKIQGHLFSKINPIKKRNCSYNTSNTSLNLKNFGLSDKELDLNFESGIFIGLGKTSLRNIINFLKKKYCNSIGIEYMYINDIKKREWIEKWLYNNIEFSSHKKIFFLKKLNEAIAFEHFIHNKFIGQKRFSIEGNESTLPALEEMIEYASTQYNTEEFIVGMSHRGRLNFLANCLKKNYSYIFNEFYGKEYKDVLLSGDVKYHLGFTKIKKNSIGNKIKISLLPNSSHLESVDAIVEGLTRSKLDHIYKKNKNQIIPILIHGDAAISGQGIVYEVIQFSKLNGYHTGGTIHIIINNQIGFTTNEMEGRSSIYCTDIAKIVMSPVLHINADDIESVIKSIYFAIDFRMRYNEDVFIDLIGYRKYGHNEGDDPRYTQPMLYKLIDKHKNVYESYKEELEKDKIINNNDIKMIETKYQTILHNEYAKSQHIKWNILNSFLEEEWQHFPLIVDTKEMFKNINTKYSLQKLINIAKCIFTLPKDKHFFKKTISIFNNRLSLILTKKLVDWSSAELLAYGTLLDEGISIRLSGEDVARGTFSQRHIIVKTENEEQIILLNKIHRGQKLIEVYNSPLSEYGVLGFDYGYSLLSPYILTIWEAQFGDFGNGAQIIIDQYIASGESKWKICNGIVLLLPHGYEGQGPEHSSARIERYLQLCANNNLFLANCTTPANYYHLLRRQMKLNFRKPLLIFTPKSLLRHPKCFSRLEDLSNGKFKEIIEDSSCINEKKIKKLIFCSGKIYYDLLKIKESIKDIETILIRIEQIYPLKEKTIHNLLNKYKNRKHTIWVQEEPENMGVWNFFLRQFGKDIPFRLIAPSESSSPSTGSLKNFLKIYNHILKKAFL
ncbi:2-oxoglutarate dehydrogenase E1 component [Blattabacterium cuenoti]|uniref:2-oxoglutarate dehydrogenase E1 component n=1 Tax=Blattabacterium cuenoti TaxID=1653831 RepID=UPI00163D0E2F|nr:2-oxoglutarate dehydrogenase E1 component [Blattabacterium cuenoti]